MTKGKQLYEGKAKKIFETDKPEILLVSYKDDATAFNGIKKGTILGKGIINNKVTNYMMRLLEKAGIPTHYIEEISERETLVKKVSIIPLEVIIRNVSAGSFAKNYGVEEGIMKLFKKCAALATSAALAGSMLASCSNTKYAMTIDGYEVRAGIFIFYTISSYYEATEIISKDGTDVSNIDNVKNAMIDNISSTEWIQYKKTTVYTYKCL